MDKIKPQEVDMHMHSTYSDGRHKVGELVNMVEKLKLKAVVLTDHDVVKGLPKFMIFCKDIGVDSMTGVEISSTDTTVEPQTIDILGYGFNSHILLRQYENLLEHNLNVRIAYIREVLELYKQKGVMDLDLVSLKNNFELPVKVANKYWVIAARANRLVASAKISETVAFEIAERELKKGGEYFVKKDKYVSTKEAISAVKECGGVAVWAHPTKTLEKLARLYEDPEKIFFKILNRMFKEGLDGLEVYTPYNTDIGKIIFLLNYAETYKLIVTGGSDFHGHHALTGDYVGLTGISYAEFLKIKERTGCIK